MKYFDTPHGDLQFQVYGRGDPVVFIHGALIADAFVPLIRVLEQHGNYLLVHYRRRGYAGGNGLPDTISMSEHARDCLDLMRYLQIERAHVVGHSFGGSVALQLSLDAPEFVHSLALLEPALMTSQTGDDYRESLSNAIEKYHAEGAERVVTAFMSARWPGYEPLIEDALPGAMAQAMAGAQPSFELDIPGLLNWNFTAAEMKRITRPVLSVLGGESTALWSRFGDVHQSLLSGLHDVHGEIVPDATHLMQIQFPHEVAAILTAFWNLHPPG